MASNRIGFKQFKNKLNKGEQVNLVVDSNILIANYDELHSNHELVRNFLEEIDTIADITFFTTVTTKAEFLDYQRKRFLTEGLFEISGSSGMGFSDSLILNMLLHTKIDHS